MRARIFTKKTASLAARAKMSAQDTLLVHRGSLSTAALARMTVSNPEGFREKSSGWNHSSFPFGLMIINDASHPYSNKLYELLSKSSYF